MNEEKLNILRDELKNKLTSLQSLNERHQKSYERNRKQILDKCAADVQRVENDLNTKLDRFLKLYQKSSSPGIQKSPCGFVYQQKLEDMFKEEEDFTMSLTKYTREQFSGGIADLASGADKSKYELLDTSKPETFLIKGSSSLSGKNREREELKRLQSAYLVSKRNCITAEMSNVKFKKAVEIAERQVKMLKSMKNFDVTGEQVAEKVEKLNKEVNYHQNLLNTAFVSELTPLLEKLQALSSTQVIQGDYSLKLLRQDYFISKQDEVIKQLLVQFSRNYLLAMLYEVEFKSQKGIHHLFSTLQSLLEDQVKKVEQRILLLNEMLLKIKPEQQIISSSDTYMNAVYEAVQPSDDLKEKLYRSYSQLLASVNALSGNEKRISQRLKSAIDERKSKMHLIESTLNNMHELMQSPSDKSNEEISGVVTNIEENLTLAENQINEVIKDLVEKNTLLSVDNVEDMKRNIMADFFNDPARLKRNLDDLEKRVKRLTKERC